ncbi:substrate-binding domain-containing protein [Demequina muriae]|uniref:Substrate-binding domain-containing protein n=1 Tax=Demequina muriae TaxID=3051664 RepID=A0ABT8GGW9_9MICO|nr:substrate-binding domain-containing protein [Demequina sp. EGI L300058]MDN4480516.1 substrate-binding domain-containing protein [Demequina sp. EGI L300058]
MNQFTERHSGHRLLWKGVAAMGAAAFVLTGCSNESTVDASESPAASGDEEIGVALILKTTTNPFFVAMQEGAEEAAAAEGATLTVAAGREDGDEDTQIQAIENSIARGDAGILITPSGQAVEDALMKAREAGLYVIALDTPPSTEDAVDITFATDNFLAGQLIGEWTATALDGEDAVIGMLDLFDDKIVSVDYARDQGFLTGMGIDVADPQVNGDEAATGSYTGGSYTIVGNEATQGAEDGGRTAMELLLAQNPDINVVYTINEPAAYGAKAALDAAGKSDVLLVSVDGGCAGVDGVESGVIGATSQQYPLKMAELGVAAITELVRTGTTPEVSEGLDFFNTGVALVTDNPVDGLESIDTATGSEICWG